MVSVSKSAIEASLKQTIKLAFILTLMSSTAGLKDLRKMYRDNEHRKHNTLHE